MAWNWKQDWWKVAAGVALIGLGAVTGGATAVAGSALIGSVVTGAAVATVVTGAIVGSELLEDAQDSAKLDRERLQLEKQQAFNSDLSTLTTLSGQYETLRDATIPGLESEISSLEDSIEGWEADSTLEKSKIQADIDSYDSLLTNWQTSYDSQTRSAQAQGRSQLGSLLSNWADAEVAAADRGMGGSMNLIANQQKQRAIEYAGSDLSLGGNDGIYGASYASMVAGLTAEQNQYNTQRGILGQSLALTTTNFNNQFANLHGQLTEKQGALAKQNENLSTAKARVEAQYTAADKARQNAGLGSDRLDPLTNWI